MLAIAEAKVAESKLGIGPNVWPVFSTFHQVFSSLMFDP